MSPEGWAQAGVLITMKVRAKIETPNFRKIPRFIGCSPSTKEARASVLPEEKPASSSRVLWRRPEIGRVMSRPFEIEQPNGSQSIRTVVHNNQIKYVFW
jgi:hypothetical protein